MARLRITSGGQTGVDRAALDAALDAGLAVGGACPAGRAAEDGPIPARYPLTETQGADPAERTRLNVIAADATLILVPDLARDAWGPGTTRTLDVAAALGKPCRAVVPDARVATACAEIIQWLVANDVGVLNVAGPRESEAPGINAKARAFLDVLFSELK